MVEYKQFYDKWKSIIWLLGISVLVYIGFRYLLPLALPFLISLLLAKLVYPIIRAIHKRWRIPVKIVAPIVLLVITAVILVILSWLAIVLIEQIKNVFVNIPVFQTKFINQLDNICRACDSSFGLDDGMSWTFIHDNVDNLNNMLMENVVPVMTAKTFSTIIWIFGVVALIFIIWISTLLILEDMEELKKEYQENKVYPYIHPILNKLGIAGAAYLRAQAIILGSMAISCSIGFWLIGNPYYLLLGILVAALDALPMIGSGLILIPWAVVQAISGNFYHASILITLFAICLAIREILEPKLIGNRIGIKPIFILIATFIGLKLFGIGGIILGPIAIVIIKITLEVVHPKTEEEGFES